MSEVWAAADSITFSVSGAGRLIGVGNGNPNSLESDKAPHRALFNGLAQAIVQSTSQPGTIVIDAIDASGNLSRTSPQR